jgi:hypothetical protein
MRFSTIFVYLALAVGLAIAGPLADRDSGGLSLTDTGNTTQPHPLKSEKSPVEASPEGEAAAELKVVGTSKREKYNPLDERGVAYLYLCYYRGCKYCYYYDLEYYQYNKCYWANYRYYSVYLYAYPRPWYGTYVGYYYYPYCRVARIPKPNRCYNIYPYGDVFGKKYW